MKIDVTQKDIDDGEPDNECECPVALAIRRALGLESRHGAYVEDVVVVNGSGVIWALGVAYRTPAVVKQFVDEFDCETCRAAAVGLDWCIPHDMRPGDELVFEPFSFELLPLEGDEVQS